MRRRLLKNIWYCTSFSTGATPPGKCLTSSSPPDAFKGSGRVQFWCHGEMVQGHGPLKQTRPTSQHAYLTPPPTSNSPLPGTPAWHLPQAQGSGLRGSGSGAYVIKNSPDMNGGPWPQVQPEPPSVYTSAQAASYFFLCLSSVPLWSPVFFLLSLSCPRCLSSSLASLMSLGSWSRVAVPLGLLSQFPMVFVPQERALFLSLLNS